MTAEIAAAFLPGFLLGLSLIIAIGAQNAFVLRQGLRKSHVFVVCLICAGSDALLIAAGVAGFGVAAARLPWLQDVMRFGGAAFLAFYGIRAFISALRGTGALSPLEDRPISLRKTVFTVLGFTWLNPHVYLDTLVLLGSVSTEYAGHRMFFALGAMSASVLFFFSLGYGARLLRPIFEQHTAWRILDFAIGCIMTSIAIKLIF